MKTAIVTGGGSGIGRASAVLLAKENFRVGLVGRRAEPLQETAELIRQAGGEAWWQALDVQDEMAVAAFVQAAAASYGGIDLLVNSAGVFEMRPFEATDPGFWQETLGINLTGAYLFCRAVWGHIRGGQIINISSIAGVKAFLNGAAYSASKYGLIGLSEVLALEGKKQDTRVHVLCPGNTETPIWEDQAPAQVRQRMLRPEQVAEAVRWLAVSPPEVSFGTLVIQPSQDVWKRR